MTRRFDDPWAASRRRDEAIRKLPIHVDKHEDGLGFAAIVIISLLIIVAVGVCLT